MQTFEELRARCVSAIGREITARQSEIEEHQGVIAAYEQTLESLSKADLEDKLKELKFVRYSAQCHPEVDADVNAYYEALRQQQEERKLFVHEEQKAFEF